MHYFTQTDMEMLNEMGYEAVFVEDIEDGDDIAFRTTPSYSDGEHKIIFFRVSNLKRVPRFDRDANGEIISNYPNYLLQWIAVDDKGHTFPMSYGSGWACYRKSENA